MIHAWSARIAGYIGKELAIDDKKIAIVSYGLEVIIGALIKLQVFILVPLVFGVFTEFMVVYLSFAFLRIAAGGVHCTAYYRCLLFSVTSYLIIAFTAIYLGSYNLPYREIYWVVLALSFLVIFAKAPIDVEEKPIISPKRRLRLKVISCLVVISYWLLSIYWDPGSIIYLASGMGILFQTFTLTQSGAKFFKWVDHII